MGELAKMLGRVSKLIEAGVTNQVGRQGAKAEVVSEDNEADARCHSHSSLKCEATLPLGE